MKDVEEERQSIMIEEEDQVKDYRNLLQQLHSLRADIRGIAFAPCYSLPYLQPGYLASCSWLKYSFTEITVSLHLQVALMLAGIICIAS